MRLICPNCGAQYEVDDSLVPDEGRDVQCSNCGHGWFQLPVHLDPRLAAELDDVYGLATAGMADEEAEEDVRAGLHAVGGGLPEPVEQEPVSTPGSSSFVQPATHGDHAATAGEDTDEARDDRDDAGPDGEAGASAVRWGRSPMPSPVSTRRKEAGPRRPMPATTAARMPAPNRGRRQPRSGKRAPGKRTKRTPTKGPPRRHPAR